jgi:hypothetical protein
MIKGRILAANASKSLKKILAAEAHLAEGQFLLEKQALNRDVQKLED